MLTSVRVSTGRTTPDVRCRRPLGGTTMMSNRSQGRLQRLLETWPVYRQLTGPDPLGAGAAPHAPRSRALRSLTETAAQPAKSLCPYCAVGCAQLVYAQD